jgi:DnaJ-class molecular chaperone
MASRTILSESAPANIHSGSSISELEKMVENCLVSGPLMSVGQIRMLLRVFDVCEECDGTGITESRGYYSDDVRQERCDACRGKGTVAVPEPVQ